MMESRTELKINPAVFTADQPPAMRPSSFHLIYLRNTPASQCSQVHVNPCHWSNERGPFPSRRAKPRQSLLLSVYFLTSNSCSHRSSSKSKHGRQLHDVSMTANMVLIQGGQSIKQTTPCQFYLEGKTIQFVMTNCNKLHRWCLHWGVGWSTAKKPNIDRENWSFFFFKFKYLIWLYTYN